MGKEPLAKSIAGEIALSKNSGNVMRKWREIFGMKQKEIAEEIGISPSVISDYESGRRSPGISFVKKFVNALIKYDSERRGFSIVEKFSEKEKTSAIIDMREFLTPMKGRAFVKKIHGKVITNEDLLDKKELFGYTAIDSIKAIVEMGEEEFLQMYGLNTERALIFTKVKVGRSPMIAIKVTAPKPAMVVLYGLSPREVDPLAIKIAKVEKIPLVVSMKKDEKALIDSIKSIEN